MSQEQRNPAMQAGDELEPRGDAAPEASSVSIPMIGGVVAAGVVLRFFHPTLSPGSLSWIALLQNRRGRVARWQWSWGFLLAMTE